MDTPEPKKIDINTASPEELKQAAQQLMGDMQHGQALLDAVTEQRNQSQNREALAISKANMASAQAQALAKQLESTQAELEAAKVALEELQEKKKK